MPQYQTTGHSRQAAGLKTGLDTVEAGSFSAVPWYTELAINEYIIMLNLPLIIHWERSKDSLIMNKHHYDQWWPRVPSTADFQFRLNIASCVAFTESSAEVLRTHANRLHTIAFRSGRCVFTFRGSIVCPRYILSVKSTQYAMFERN